MSARDCIKAKAEVGLVPKAKGDAAFNRINEIQMELLKEGESAKVAENMAAAQYAEELKRANAKAKWRLINRVRVMRELEADLYKMPVDKMGAEIARMTDGLNFESRAIHNAALGMMNKYLREHHPTMLGTLTGAQKKPLEFMDFLRAASGEAAKTPEGRAMADAYMAMMEWLRQKANSYGYSIAKLEWRGLPHSHDAMAIWKAGFGVWKADIAPRMKWETMINPKTGMEFKGIPDARTVDDYLKGMFDNIVYGRNSKNPQWGVNAQGGALERHRAIHFKTADDWIAYNKKYGRMDPHSAMLEEIGTLARHIAVARRYGPTPEAALNYLDGLVAKRAKDEAIAKPLADKAHGGVEASRNMVRYLNGGASPRGHWTALSAAFFATTRKALTSAMLGSAVVPSIPSDIASASVAATAMKLNPGNIMATYVKLMQEAATGGGEMTNTLLLAQHIAESIGNPGVTASRIMEEYPAQAWAEHFSNAVMRVQGLSAHTDAIKLSWQWSMGGELHNLRNTSFDDLPNIVLDMMKMSGITSNDWDNFRNSAGIFTAPNGAKVLDPLYWRTATTHPDPDDIALKLQSFVERTTEIAVPSGSLRAKGFFEPSARGLEPGSWQYEVAKSAGMFKTFPLAYSMNQLLMFRLVGNTYSGMQKGGAKAAYVTGMLLATMIAGAISMQATEILRGREPRPMEGREFWVTALLKGGGLGPAGDLLASGTTSWGTGLPGYFAGPIVNLGNDALKLTMGNLMTAASQAMDGDEIDTGFFKEAVKFLGTYTPGNNLWFAATAFDRIVADQLQLLLDPEGATDLAKRETARQNRSGNSSWWAPGDVLPGVPSPLQ